MSSLDDAAREAAAREKERQRFLARNPAKRTRTKKNDGGGSGGNGGNGGGTSDNDWRLKLRRTFNNKGFLGDMENAKRAFTHAPDLQGLVRYNELTRRIEFGRAPPWRSLDSGAEWMDDDDVALACFLQGQDIPMHSELAVSRVVHMVAFSRRYHPVRDWLRSLKWDGEPRIKEGLIEILGAEGDGRYLGAVLTRFMVSAVARVMRPGCMAQHLIVLIGAERMGKSSFAQVLGEPWTVESNATFGTKDSICELEGAWLIEIGELASMNRSHIEIMNHFISRQIDHYRPAYGRAVIDQRRSNVFIGTTNEVRFLRSVHGNRRFWPIMCGRINLQLLREMREQLWAEAVALFDAGEQWHLTEEEEKLAATVQENHRIVSEVEEDVRVYLEQCLSAKNGEGKPMPTTTRTVRDIFDAIAGEHERGNLSARRQVETAIGHALQRCGWKNIGRKGQDKRTTYQYVAPEVDNLDNPTTRL